MSDNKNIIEKMQEMERRLNLVEDREAIQRVQNIYGYYIDNRMWRKMADLFTDDDPSMEIGRRGNYVGKERIHQFLRDALGNGRWGLLPREIANHMQLQVIITVSEDRTDAKARCRAIIQGDSPPGSGKLVWAEGVYENEYVREGEDWKIKRLWWLPTFYVEMDGFDKAVFQSGPESTIFPPDRPSPPADEALGRAFPPFHYRHPFTGAETPVPHAKQEV